MDRRDQELLDTQIKRFQPPSRRDGPMILAIVGVFLAGMTAGGFLFAAYRGQPTVQTASGDEDGISVFLERHSERRALIGFVAAADNQSPCFDRDRLLHSLECIVLTPQELSNGLYVRFLKGPSVPGPFLLFKDELRNQ